MPLPADFEFVDAIGTLLRLIVRAVLCSLTVVRTGTVVSRCGDYWF